MSIIADGVYTAAITPLDDSLNIDHRHLTGHCAWLLEEGASGILLMGTTGEANSFSIEERKSALTTVLQSGIPVEKLIVGTGCCSYKDAIELTRHALNMGVHHILMLPPFYYKNVGDEGLFLFFEKIIREIDDNNWNIYFYHFPAMSGIFLSDSFIQRLINEFPDHIAGMKDSGDNWKHIKNMHRNFPGIKTFAGSEKYLSDILTIGGAGCITATLNLSVSLAAKLFVENDPEETSRLQKNLNTLRQVVEKYPIIPAIKQAMRLVHNNDNWRRVRPPQTPMKKEQVKNLEQDLESVGFPETYIFNF